MDRGENKKHNYITQKEYILKQAALNSQKYLPTKSPKEVREIVDAVLNSQYRVLNQKTYTHTEAEISGLGRYYLSLPRANRYLKSVQKSILYQEEKIKRENIFPPTTPRLEQLKQILKELTYKIHQANEFKTAKRIYETASKSSKEQEANNLLDNNQHPAQ